METTTLNVNDVKKELMKSKAMANLSHYKKGNLYYNVNVFGNMYQFPISTIEYELDENKNLELVLSKDLGDTTFNAEIRGSELNRWIAKAFAKNEFKKID